MSRTALIAGGTGLVGNLLLQLLQNDKEYKEIIVLTRKLIPSTNEKVIQHTINFEHLNEHKEKLLADDVFCCLGTTMKKAGSKKDFYKVDYIYALNLAKIASENKASSFNLISAMGANKDSGIFYNKVKGGIEQAVSSLKFRVINILRPSLIMGERQESRPFEKLAQVLSKAFPFIYSGSLKKFRPIEARVIAQALLNAAKWNPQGIHIIESNELEIVARKKVKTT